jgi:hypothetical protein
MPVKRADREGRSYWDREDPFPCLNWCGSQGRLVPSLLDERRCTLPGYSGTWADAPRPARQLVWLGRSADHENRDYRPAEPVSDGCPGGWARCRFAESVLRYRRRRVEGGGHDANPLIHANTPPHIIEAIAYFEGQEAIAMGEYNRKRFA